MTGDDLIDIERCLLQLYELPSPYTPTPLTMPTRILLLQQDFSTPVHFLKPQNMITVQITNSKQYSENYKNKILEKCGSIFI